MFPGARLLALIGAVSLPLFPAPTHTWTLASSGHFEVYSEAGPVAARSALVWFERLHAVAEQLGFHFPDRPPVRIVGFDSTAEYNEYRLHPTADAFFVGTEERDYIVLPSLSSEAFSVAAHEYAHAILHASGTKLACWLDDGLAEIASTVRFSDAGVAVGGPLPSRVGTLQQRSWMPLSQLFTEIPPAAQSRDRAELFYAEDWALADMLVFSPQYGPRFRALIAALDSGTPSSRALAERYGKPLDAIQEDVRRWIARPNPSHLSLPPVAVGRFAANVSELSRLTSGLVLAELYFALGNLNHAQAIYRDLARELPDNGDVLVALAVIALRKGDPAAARYDWSRAIRQGITDADLCYRYAILAGDLGIPVDEIRAALHRAVSLRPGFDDARYRLALLENNAGHYDAALEQFRAMRTVAPLRAFNYWSAMAYALGELGHRDEAVGAAKHAAEHADTSAQRERASELAYIARTDLAVRFVTDANGHAQLAMTRIPHGESDWNPFIQPGDRIRRTAGRLVSIGCTDGHVTGVMLDAAGTNITLSIPDPLKVLMRHAPTEFSCGPQSGSSVTIEYAASETPDPASMGVLRGMDFK